MLVYLAAATASLHQIMQANPIMRSLVVICCTGNLRCTILSCLLLTVSVAIVFHSTWKPDKEGSTQQGLPAGIQMDQLLFAVPAWSACGICHGGFKHMILPQEPQKASAGCFQSPLYYNCCSSWLKLKVQHVLLVIEQKAGRHLTACAT